jgi:hypothetical protein
MNSRLAARAPAGPGSHTPVSTAAVRRPPPRFAVHAAMALHDGLLRVADRMMPPIRWYCNMPTSSPRRTCSPRWRSLE